jgi:L-ascorbate metabolism protein UlaG (beta-lactamase superfamily)
MKLAAALLIAAAACAQSSRPVEEFKTSAGTLKITPIRHASLMIEAGGQTIAVDPWSQGSYDGVPKADLVLITDIHGDHFDPAGIDKVRKPGMVIFAPKAVVEKLPEATAIANAETRNWGRWTIEAIPMYNLKRGPAEGKLYHDKGRGNGYVIAWGGLRIYVAGDTEGVPEMRALRNIDVAFVPMNLPFTMTPEEAADAVRAFKPKVAYPYHYRQSDTNVFASALSGSGVEVRQRNWYY